MARNSSSVTAQFSPQGDYFAGGLLYTLCPGTCLIIPYRLCGSDSGACLFLWALIQGYLFPYECCGYWPWVQISWSLLSGTSWRPELKCFSQSLKALPSQNHFTFLPWGVFFFHGALRVLFRDWTRTVRPFCGYKFCPLTPPPSPTDKVWDNPSSCCSVKKLMISPLCLQQGGSPMAPQHQWWLSGERICLPMQEMQEMWVQSLGWKIPWRWIWQPTPVFLPGKSHGQRSLAGHSLWGCRVRHDWVTDTACVDTGLGELLETCENGNSCSAGWS